MRRGRPVYASWAPTSVWVELGRLLAAVVCIATWAWVFTLLRG